MSTNPVSTRLLAPKQRGTHSCDKAELLDWMNDFAGLKIRQSDLSLYAAQERILAVPKMGKDEPVGIEGALEALFLEKRIPQYDEADSLHNPLDVCRSYLADLLCGLVGCEPDVAYRSIQWPSDISKGDLTVTLPKLLPGVKPSGWTPDLMEKFPNDHILFLPPILEGVHLRIFLSQDVLPRLFVPYILDRTGVYGSLPRIGLRNPKSPEEGCKRLLVESSSPNITSEFQGRHVRSTLIGAFVAKSFERMGWDVVKINYLGDWGKNIALLKVGWDRFGDEEAYQADPIQHLLDVYHHINEVFKPEVAASKHARDEAAKNGVDEGEAQAGIENQGIYAERNAASKKLEDGDKEALAFWKRVRDVNIAAYDDLYAQLGVTFDEHTGESQVSAESMVKIEQLLKEKNISKESAGASVVHMQDHGLRAGTAVLRDRTGQPMYLLRDLATMVERSDKYKFDRMIIVAGNNNNAHFTQLHHILIALGMKELADKIHHLKFNDVSSMSEKLGQKYKPQAIINECEKTMIAALEADNEKATPFGNSEQIAKKLGVSALVAQELATQTASAHNFDTSIMTAFKTCTGPELQYWYAKLCLLLKDRTGNASLTDADYESLADDEPVDLLRILIQFPEVAHAAHTSLKPSGIITYLTSVVEQLEACLSDDDDGSFGVEEGEVSDAVQVNHVEKEFTAGQLALFESTRIVLKNGMTLLGITPVARIEIERADTPVAE